MVFKDHFDLSQAIQTQAIFFLQKYGPTIVNQFFDDTMQPKQLAIKSLTV